MQYRDRLEQELSNMNTKQAFQKVKILTGQQTTQHNFTKTDPLNFANSLNSFFNWFNTQDYTATSEELLKALPLEEPQHPPFTQEDVQQQLARCKIGKAPGPDGIPARNKTEQPKFPPSGRPQPFHQYSKNSARQSHRHLSRRSVYAAAYWR